MSPAQALTAGLPFLPLLDDQERQHPAVALRYQQPTTKFWSHTNVFYLTAVTETGMEGLHQFSTLTKLDFLVGNGWAEGW